MIDISLILAGGLTGFIVGLTGVGGGALMTPILIFFFGISPTVAVGTDLWFAVFTKLVGARIYYQSGHVDWQVVKRLWVGSLPMALITVLIIAFGTSIQKAHSLIYAIGLLVLVTACGLLLSPYLFKIAKTKRIGNPEKFRLVQPSLTVFAGMFLGLCVALTSVGAGALGAVIMTYLYPLRMTSHRLVATDLVHAIPLAVVSGMGYLILGMVDWTMLLNLLLGSVPAIVVGSILAKKVSARLLQIMLAIVLAGVGLKAIFY